MADNKPDGSQKQKWSIGRAPWYNENASKPFVIGVTGGSASGKTSVCQSIVDHLNIPWVGLLSMDRYYKGLTPEQQEIAKQGSYNFDHPDAFDMDKLYETITELKTGRAVDVPIYDFTTHSRLEQTDRMYGVDVIIVEGILLFYSEKVRDLLDLKIYVDTDNDLRLARRIKRDIAERGRDVENVLEQYQRTVKPSFEQFIQPTKRFADLIIPWNNTNQVAIDLLTQHIMSRLEKRQIMSGSGGNSGHASASSPYLKHRSHPAPSVSGHHTPTLGPSSRAVSNNTTPIKTQSQPWTNSPYIGVNDPQKSPLIVNLGNPDDIEPLPSTYRGNKFQFTQSGSSTPTIFAMNASSTGSSSKPLLLPNKLPENLRIIPPTKSLMAIHTTLRDRRTDIDDFRFAMTRLVRIISAEALSFIDYTDHAVTTSTGAEFHGVNLSGNVVGVSVVRAGAAFEAPLREVIQDIPIGKIVIQQHASSKTDGPRLYYAKLPDGIAKNTKVLLFDGVLATGGAVLMAIHVLIDHGVLPENIIFCCVAAAPEGIINIATAFPEVHIVTSAIEEGLDHFLFSKPGVGFIGDRYFGTTRSHQYAPTPKIVCKTLLNNKGSDQSSNDAQPTFLSLNADVGSDDVHHIPVDPATPPDDESIPVIPL